MLTRVTNFWLCNKSQTKQFVKPACPIIIIITYCWQPRKDSYSHLMLVDIGDHLIKIGCYGNIE